MKIIDLSKEIYSGMDVYQGDPQVKIESIHNYESHGWNLDMIHMGSHTGTHMDSFSHMDPQGQSLDRVPLERFISKCRLNSLESASVIYKDPVGVEVLDAILASNVKLIAGDISLELEEALLRHQILTLTDLINLDQLPLSQEFTLIAFPLKIRNSNGSPVRAVAIIEGGL